MTLTTLDPRMMNASVGLLAHDGSSLTGLPSDVVKLQETDLTSLSAATFTDITATYDTYMFVINNLNRSGAANTSPQLRLSNNGGSSYHSSGYMRVYDGSITYSTGGPNYTQDGNYNTSGIRIGGSINANTFAVNIVGYVHNPLDSSHFTYCQGISTAIYDVTNDPFSSVSWAGKYNTAQANDAFQINLESGSMGDGTFYVYGLK